MDANKVVRWFGLVVLLVSLAGHAQTSANGTEVEELRKQLEELRKQMSAIQSKLDAMGPSSVPSSSAPAATGAPQESTVQTGNPLHRGQFKIL